MPAADNINKGALLKGNVIEIYQRDGKNFAKVYYRTGYVEIDVTRSEEIHLGDEVKIECDIQVQSIEHII